MTTPAPCPFCFPAEDRIAFEDRLTRALWDAFPVSEGHLLLVPRRHGAHVPRASPIPAKRAREPPPGEYFLVKRTLIITPANLSFQWQRELKEKFREQFEVVRSDVRANYGMNPWQDRNQFSLRGPSPASALEHRHREGEGPAARRFVRRRLDRLVLDVAR